MTLARLTRTAAGGIVATVRRSRWALVVVVLLSTLTVACRPARAGARCATTDWGEQGSWVLRCVGGRWQRALTKSDAARILLATRPTTTTSTTTTVFVPASPEEERVRDIATAVWGSSYWAGQVLTVPWRVVPDDELSGFAGVVNCRYRTWSDGTTTSTASGRISQTSATEYTDDELGDLLAHEGAHVIACYRWPTTSAPPGFPPALNGADPAESFAECFARYLRGPDYRFTYGCPNDELPATATQAAVP